MKFLDFVTNYKQDQRLGSAKRFGWPVGSIFEIISHFFILWMLIFINLFIYCFYFAFYFFFNFSIDIQLSSVFHPETDISLQIYQLQIFENWFLTLKNNLNTTVQTTGRPIFQIYLPFGGHKKYTIQTGELNTEISIATQSEYRVQLPPLNVTLPGPENVCQQFNGQLCIGIFAPPEIMEKHISVDIDQDNNRICVPFIKNCNLPSIGKIHSMIEID